MQSHWIPNIFVDIKSPHHENLYLSYCLSYQHMHHYVEANAIQWDYVLAEVHTTIVP